MKELAGLYQSGLQYMQYLETGEPVDREKHLHYLKKMMLSREEAKLFQTIYEPVKLLVFCDISCNDCRIFLAILENIRRMNPQIQYRIANREENREVMTQLDMNCRIPLAVKITEQNPVVLFNELPDALRVQMCCLQQEEADILRMDYRKGFHKDVVMLQLSGALQRGLK